MAKLSYSIGTSVDGFVEDASGDFSFAEPPPDVHELANRRAREASAFVFGRRMYETMEPYWPDLAADPSGAPAIETDFARAYVETPRFVFSDSLESVGDGVQLAPRADLRAETERLKAELDGHIDLGGPTMAAAVVDLIDEFHMWVSPVAIGDGKRYWPPSSEPLLLRLVENRTCERGFVYLRYERAR